MLTFFPSDYSRGGASGNKLKMTLGLPVYVKFNFSIPMFFFIQSCARNTRTPIPIRAFYSVVFVRL